MVGARSRVETACGVSAPRHARVRGSADLRPRLRRRDGVAPSRRRRTGRSTARWTIGFRRASWSRPRCRLDGRRDAVVPCHAGGDWRGPVAVELALVDPSTSAGDQSAGPDLAPDESSAAQRTRHPAHLRSLRSTARASRHSRTQAGRTAAAGAVVRGLRRRPHGSGPRARADSRPTRRAARARRLTRRSRLAVGGPCDALGTVERFRRLPRPRSVPSRPAAPEASPATAEDAYSQCGLPPADRRWRPRRRPGRVDVHHLRGDQLGSRRTGSGDAMRDVHRRVRRGPGRWAPSTTRCSRCRRLARSCSSLGTSTSGRCSRPRRRRFIVLASAADRAPGCPTGSSSICRAR